MGLDDKIQLLKISVSAQHGMKKRGMVFSIVDVVAVLTDAPDYQAARNYWKVTKSVLLTRALNRLHLVTS